MIDVPIEPVAPVIDLSKHRSERVAEDGTFIPRVVRSRTAKFCAHRQVAVDSTSRVVECRGCGAVLDPIDVICMFAQEEGNFCFMQKHLKQQIVNLKEEVAALTKRRNNLRTSVRRAAKEGDR